MALKAESRHIGSRDPLQRTIKQGNMCCAQIIGKSCRIDCEAMVLAGDDHPLAIEILNRMVRTVMSKLHFHSTRPRSQCEQLMTQADAESWNSRCRDLLDCTYGVITRAWISWSIGKQYPIRLHGSHLGPARLSRHHRDTTSTHGSHTKNVALHSKVIGNNVEGKGGCGSEAATQ